MASKSDIRICVNVGEQISRLLSVKELSNGDLVVNIQPAEFYREAGEILKPEDPKIVNQKYSIHRSIKSDKINAIVHRIDRNGKETCTSNYTKALKLTNKYAILYGARAPDLSHKRYSVNPSERDYISIASFNKKMPTLYYMISVCNKSTEPVLAGNDYLVKYIEFSYFKLAIIWSYSPISARSSGMKSHFMTIKPEDMPAHCADILSKISDGYSASEIIKMYQYCRKLQHQELRKILELETPDIKTDDLRSDFSLPFTVKTSELPLVKIRK